MNKKIKIAVCLYGQPRKLEYTSKYIKKYYDNENYEIDYFCSAKTYYEWFTDKRKLGIIETDDANEIAEKISKIYNPKSLRIIPKRLDDLCDYDKIQKIHLAFADSILLKSEYEALNNFHYDITILQRYDSIIYPMHETLDFIVNSLMNAKNFTNPNHVFHFRMGNYNKKGNIIKMLQDVAFFSIGNSMDIFASELIKYVGEFGKRRQSDRVLDDTITNIHELIYDIFAKNNIEMHEFKNELSQTKVNVTIVRDGLEHLDILERDTWFKYKDLWAKTQT
jgi:hypothetical protein